MRYLFERSIMLLLARVVLRRELRVIGRDRIPRHGPLIVIGNHIATCDPPLVGALIPRRDIAYMAKSESFQGAWWYRFLLRGYHAFPVVRHSADRAALRRSLDQLASGHVLVMYPEGARSPNAQMTRAYAGVGFIARHSGAPILPAAIWGSERVLPKGAILPRHAPVRVVYGEPFHLPERNPDGSRMSNQQTADWMMSRLAELLPLEYRGVYAPGGEATQDTKPAA
jgi:1-acyl-sn-glycerol-3-phosphate acyltransferase